MNKKTEDEVVIFLKELLHPEGFGWAVTSEIRNQAHQLLIMIESNRNNE